MKSPRNGAAARPGARCVHPRRAPPSPCLIARATNCSDASISLAICLWKYPPPHETSLSRSATLPIIFAAYSFRFANDPRRPVLTQSSEEVEKVPTTDSNIPAEEPTLQPVQQQTAPGPSTPIKKRNNI